MNEKIIDQAYIQERVTNWVFRVNCLYTLVKSTLINYENIEFSEKRTTHIHEELMQRYDVNSVQIPILDVRQNKELIASFKPLGLWVIGANGRIDVLTKTGSLILVDVGTEGRSNWMVYALDSRSKGRAFDSTFITSLVTKQ